MDVISHNINCVRLGLAGFGWESEASYAGSFPPSNCKDGSEQAPFPINLIVPHIC
jgi:hypothetical protein